MKYILEGNPKEVAKVIQENRIRVERGQISFALVPDEEVNPEAADTKDVIDEDTKDVIDEDTKDAPTKTSKRTKKSE